MNITAINDSRWLTIFLELNKSLKVLVVVKEHPNGIKIGIKLKNARHEIVDLLVENDHFVESKTKQPVFGQLGCIMLQLRFDQFKQVTGKLELNQKKHIFPSYMR